MVAVAIWPLIFAIIGILMYALCSNGKLAEVGRIVFFCGFFFLVMVLAEQVLHIPPK